MDDLHGNDLKAAYWINTHRQELNAAARIAGFVIVGIIWLIVLIYIVVYIRNYSKTERAIAEAGLTTINYSSIQAPKNIIVLARDATPHSNTTIDAYALVQNPNKFYAGRFSFSFTIQGVTKTFDTGLVMPEETTYLVVNNVTAPSTASVEVKIEEVTWQRIHGPDIEVDFQTADINLATGELASQATTVETDAATETDATTIEPDVVADEEFVVPTTETEEEVGPVGEAFTQLTANITNASAYGFERVRIIAILRNEQEQILAIQQTVWSSVDSFSTMPLEINWLKRFAFNTKAEIIIQTDIWDKTNLILPGGD